VPVQGYLEIHHVASTAERAVIRLVADGLSDEEIAALLAFSVRTIETRIYRFSRRSGLRGRRLPLWSRQHLTCCLRSI